MACDGMLSASHQRHPPARKSLLQQSSSLVLSNHNFAKQSLSHSFPFADPHFPIYLFSSPGLRFESPLCAVSAVSAPPANWETPTSASCSRLDVYGADWVLSRGIDQRPASEASCCGCNSSPTTQGVQWGYACGKSGCVTHQKFVRKQKRQTRG